eukprot:5550146-Ditylum_brightwellii.AAC.1
MESQREEFQRTLSESSVIKNDACHSDKMEVTVVTPVLSFLNIGRGALEKKKKETGRRFNNINPEGPSTLDKDTDDQQLIPPPPSSFASLQKMHDNEIIKKTSCKTKTCTQGCGAKIHITKLTKHITQLCPKRLVTCSMCGDEKLFADEMKDHMNGSLRDQSCPMRMVTCSVAGCKEKMHEKDLSHHQTTTCPFRLVVCKCGMKVNANDYENHCLVECLASPKFCSLGCNQKVCQKDMKCHQIKDCTNRHRYEEEDGRKMSWICPNKCGMDVDFHDRFLHLSEECPQRLIECRYGCSKALVAQDNENDKHERVCLHRPISCGENSNECVREFRHWIATEDDGGNDHGRQNIVS